MPPQYYSGLHLSYPMPMPQVSDPQLSPFLEFNESKSSSSSSSSSSEAEEAVNSNDQLEQEIPKAICFATYGKRMYY